MTVRIEMPASFELWHTVIHPAMKDRATRLGQHTCYASIDGYSSVSVQHASASLRDVEDQIRWLTAVHAGLR